MMRFEFRAVALSLWLVAGCFGGIASANEAIHDKVDKSLVYLEAEGEGTVGQSLGLPIKTQGTGFFIGDGGYILTTAHFFDPLKDAFATNTKIHARFVGTGVGMADVLYVSELASLDLVLLRAFLPRNIDFPASLEIGSSKDIDLAKPGLLTSGYDKIEYRRKKLELNNRSSKLAPYAWTMNGKSNSGQSGSPVYIDKDGEPLVVGVLKATAREDDTLTLMIPIENSFPLIGHFKMREMQEDMAGLRGEIVRLEKIIGETEEVPERSVTSKIGDVSGSIDRIWTALGPLTENDNDPPLFDRVDYVEDSVNEIAETFDWEAQTDPESGTLVVAYEKLISGGPQIDEVSIKITPEFYLRKGSRAPDNKIKVPRYLFTMPAQTAGKTKPGDPSGKRADFVFDGVQDELTSMLGRVDGTFKDKEPYRKLRVNIVADLGGKLVTKELYVDPTYDWKY